MLPSSSSTILRLARPSTASVALFGGSSTAPASNQRVSEPGYLGYLSHAVSNIITNLTWNTTNTTSPPTDPSTSATVPKKHARPIVLKVSRSEVSSKTTALVRKLLHTELDSINSLVLRIKELSNHLQAYPATRLSAVQDPQLISLLLNLESSTSDDGLKRESRICLALCGYVKPPKGRGYNLLTIDGGGTRGMMGLEVLEALETASGGKKVHELFDHIVGVSTGAIIAVMLGVKKMSVAECRQTYMEISRKLFSQTMISGATGLIFNHSYYDTKKWILMLKEILGDKMMICSSGEEGTPKISVVSSIVNLPLLEPFIFRNYEHSAGRDSHYRGGTSHNLWQAVQASAAAPGYFEEVILGDILHQDGGVIANNPTAIGVHEAKTLWPDEKLSCLVSVGNGRTVQELEPTPLFSASKTRHKILKIVDSATDTEAVHIAVRDLIDESKYYRFNPYMSHPYGLDEIDAARLEQMVLDAKLYVRRNIQKITTAATQLNLKPTTLQTVTRSLQDYKHRRGGYAPH